MSDFDGLTPQARAVLVELIAAALRAAEARGLERSAKECDSLAERHRKLRNQYPVGSLAAFEFHCYVVQSELDARAIRALSEPSEPSEP